MLRRTLLCAPIAILARGDETGFTPLFDGRTLSGWSVEDGPPSCFYADRGDVVVHRSGNDPAWLRSDLQYENFELRGEFFIKGWSDSGIYLHAPRHGRPAQSGLRVNIFQQKDDPPLPVSCGSIFPVIAPRTVNVTEGWNSFRILCDWPALQVWMNDALIHDLDQEREPLLRYRLRRGYLGLVNLSYPVRFRNFRIRELASKDNRSVLYDRPEHLAKNWFKSDKDPKANAVGEVLYLDGDGNLASRDKYRDFDLRMYVRGSRDHNGGVIFRSAAKPGEHGYEIQLHNVEGAHYPTGSLYHYQRARYPRIAAEQWFHFQLQVKDATCAVWINGEQVLAYDHLKNLDSGHLELQAHRTGYWIEYKEITVKNL
jgi:hypothetical protein